jgi:hypothetical protein
MERKQPPTNVVIASIGTSDGVDLAHPAQQLEPVLMLNLITDELGERQGPRWQMSSALHKIEHRGR